MAEQPERRKRPDRRKSPRRAEECASAGAKKHEIWARVVREGVAALAGAIVAFFGSTYGYSWLTKDKPAIANHAEVTRAAEERRIADAVDAALQRQLEKKERQ